ncbi:hypothetical protein COOONC_02129 [Cooperia oncophora]
MTSPPEPKGVSGAITNADTPSDTKGTEQDTSAGDGASHNQAKQQKSTFEEILEDLVKELTHEERVDFRANSMLRVMVDFLHPDERSIVDCVVVSKEDFYQLCSRLSKFEFNTVRDLDVPGIDVDLLNQFYEELVWICASILVPLLSEKALLAENLIDFRRLDLDIFHSEDIDPYKELTMMLAIADDFCDVPELKRRDRCRWLDKCQVMKETLEALKMNDKQLLKQLGVLDTAESVIEKIELGMAIAEKDITSIIPNLLSRLKPDERDRCLARHLGKREMTKTARSWVQLVRNTSSPDQCIELLPSCLRDILLSDLSNKASLYAAAKRMAEEMPITLFKKDAVFLISSPTISLSDLLKFALEQYEDPSKTLCGSRYTFIESIFLAVRELLSDNKTLSVDLNEIFCKLQVCPCVLLTYAVFSMLCH